MEPTAAPLAPPAGAARHRRLRTAIIAVAAAVALVGAWLVFGGERAQQSSEDDARRRLAAAPTTAVTGNGSVPTSGPQAPSRFSAQPAPGLYRFGGSGREVTSFPPLTEQQGPDMPATVTASTTPGCWVFRIDYNTHHWQDWTYCTGDGTLREERGSTFARRTFGTLDVDNTSTFRCDPVATLATATDGVGATHPRSCSGSGTLVPAVTTVTGTMTLVGEEPIAVGGREVPTVHVRYDFTYGGGQTGSERNDLWFETRTGLPVRNDRSIRVDTETPFGKVTYTEDADFLLRSTDPT